MAYKWSSYCLTKYEDNEDKRWLFLLATCTVILFFGSLVVTVLLYINFGSTDCKLNQFFISFNLILSFFIAILSVHPRVQEENPQR